MGGKDKVIDDYRVAKDNVVITRPAGDMRVASDCGIVEDNVVVSG